MAPSKIIMKNKIFINIIIIVNIFSWSIYSQKAESTMPQENNTTTQSYSSQKYDSIPEQGSDIVAYKVVEKINQNFGGYTLTYTVSNKSLIRTNELGKGNTRTVIPIYGKKHHSLDVKTEDIIETSDEIERLKREGNKFYFAGALDKSAGIYKQLFALTSKVEPEYFFRYSLSLKYIDEIDTANEMMKQYNKKAWEKYSQKKK